MELSILLGAGASAGLRVPATKRMAEEFLIQHKDLELLHDTSFLNCNDIEEILKNVNDVKRLENHHLLTPYLNDIE